jgi:nucleoside-diphosphate-sugar epimerase
MRASLGDVEARLPTDLSHVIILYEAVNPDWWARDSQATPQINVDSIVGLLEDCCARGLTPVFMSTDYLYDRRLNERFGDEPRSATTEYGRQKREVEQVA